MSQVYQWPGLILTRQISSRWKTTIKLAEELEFIKSVVLEQFESVRKLQLAKKWCATSVHDASDIDDSHLASVSQPMRQKPSRLALRQVSSKTTIETPHSCNNESGSDTNEDLQGSQSPSQRTSRGRQSMDSAGDSSVSPIQSFHRNRAARHPASAWPSSSLLHMIPFVSSAVSQLGSTSVFSSALVNFQRKDNAEGTAAPVFSVCLLLDKWTLSGSEPLTSLLGDNLEENYSDQWATDLSSFASANTLP